MQKRKTYFEQVPIEVAEKAQREATTPAEMRQPPPALSFVGEREVVADLVKNQGKLPPKESR